jgi:hypothetical protein
MLYDIRILQLEKHVLRTRTSHAATGQSAFRLQQGKERPRLQECTRDGPLVR